MTFLKAILSGFDTLDISYEEHYDPNGMELFKLHIHESFKPIMVFSAQNSDQALITISSDYSPPILESLNYMERIRLKFQLMKLGLKLVLHHKLGLDNNSVVFSIGIILNSKNFHPDAMKRGIEKLRESYNLVMNEAIAIIEEYYVHEEYL
ncbi:MAG: hypothetical protein IH840_16955 [Candidatus Heimdallarchaeota archaeon]|nr:hypothetical protein [Candidatus Heimdallarchaeota archaeon]